jgi:hypothetical protein
MRIPLLALTLSALMACNEAARDVPIPNGATEAPGSPAPLTDLIDPRYPTGLADEEGWDYRRTLEGDLDGDGSNELVIIAARAALSEESTLPPEQAPDSLFMWDLHEPWQIWIEETSGERTCLYSKFTSGWITGHLDAAVPPRVVLELDNGDSTMRVSVRYFAPDSLQASRDMVARPARTPP